MYFNGRLMASQKFSLKYLKHLIKPNNVSRTKVLPSIPSDNVTESLEKKWTNHVNIKLAYK